MSGPRGEGARPPRYRLGVDIGGTFTDAVLVDEETGETRIAKLPTTPTDPSIGFMNVTRRLVSAGGVDPRDVAIIVHGTTVATNAVIEGNVARTAFVTTEGFRDMLEIARQIRPSLYDLQFQKPVPLVPRQRCFEVTERLNATGEILVPLDEASVLATAAAIRALDVESVAICLLHSYINPAHEHRVAELLREALPGVAVSASADVAPEFREYFRASTAVVNAAIQPVVQRYLEGVSRRVAADGYDAALLVMQSGGGVMSFEQAARRPVFMIESGPAAGVMATVHLADRLAIGDVISFDMGGTTAKVGLIRGGVPSITKDFEVGGVATPGIGGVARGSGYPIRTPVIELVEIGAGGGSIAWLDSGGILRVGPRSAGAEPGPACYQRGGTEPTVSDANLVLGRLSPARFLGGEMALDPDLARKAIEDRCAAPLGHDVVRTANGIVEIANVAMANALRLVSVNRGHDPRDFALVSFGGAGPLHANRLAAMLGIPRVIIPPAPGAFSALGLLTTDLKHDLTRTIRLRSDGVAAERLEAAFAEMTAHGMAELARELAPTDATEVRRYAEMRYAGQSHELNIPLAPGPVVASTVARLIADFHQAHQLAYGFHVLTEPTMIMNIRTSVIGRIRRPGGEPPEGARPGPGTRLGPGTVAPAVGVVDARPYAHRPVYFAEASGFVEAGLFERDSLVPGSRIAGPAIVEQHDSTCVVHPGYRALAGVHGELIIEAVA